ncbi:MAG: hypothetical protein WC307_02870 [Candidatus Nanoarchaeia archaeon]|jgi:archaellum component FlaG (FlaF/FlaG flagellin family)
MKSLNYGKLFITIIGTETNKGTLVVNIKIKNNASVQSIIFPNEEIRLIVDGQVVLLDDYKFENNLDSGQEVTGTLSFKTAKKAKKTVLQFGKTVLPKINVEL